jgi:hypothetical protein
MTLAILLAGLGILLAILGSVMAIVIHLEFEDEDLGI